MGAIISKRAQAEAYLDAMRAGQVPAEPTAQVARRFGISPQCLYERLKESGKPTRARDHGYRSQTDRILADWDAALASPVPVFATERAEAIGVDDDVYRRTLRDHARPTRHPAMPTNRRRR